MLCLVQYDYVESVQQYKKKAEEWEDEVRKNEEYLKKLESEKKREQYEGELEDRLTWLHTPDWDSVVSIAAYSTCIVCAQCV